MSLLARLLINAAALWVAVRLVPGISHDGTLVGLLGVALVFGIVNTIVRPIVMLFSLPLLFLTLGLFTFVVNALLLLLTSALSGALGLGFHVAGFFAALVGALVVSVVSFALSLFVEKEKTR
jgi:putative membrane protein